jgi:hypothetical protein
LDDYFGMRAEVSTSGGAARAPSLSASTTANDPAASPAAAIDDRRGAENLHDASAPAAVISP